ncbi:ATP-binding protein [Vibrio sp. JC009]|uniref:ATP-binding protein n=1 Tax=Vibrio sp. JC009 TaxID=2912314 RepID=UPI0023B0274F|nr:ATP-binding protein [Vibrio sp. JC009]WED22588.1 ATP-binding protein [Vibrio sp. JC009]
MRRRKKRVVITIALLYFLTIALGGQLYWNFSYERQVTADNTKLHSYASQLSALLEKYTYIPQLLSKDSELIDALKNPANSAQIDLANRYLLEVNQIIEASDTYLLNIEGTTLASSNWQKENSFIGRNFAFRPYFQQAIQGDKGQYFALGSTSGKRGFYYSFPIVHAAEILGIIVVKTNLTDIEQNWAGNGSYVLVSDNKGIIFMSSHTKWLYKSFTPLSEKQKQAISESQQYLDKEIVSLNFTRTKASQPAPENTSELIKQNSAPGNGTYISSQQEVDFQNLTVSILSPKIQLFWSAMSFTAMLTVAFALIVASWLLIKDRRERTQQIAHIEEEAKQRLEYQVKTRTAKLQKEIEEREKTEAALRKTQDELIQAAKLAVLGEMSASISHELNNPLAAIRSFAENGKKFLDKGQPERTADNLSRISDLTERMAKISQQLKSFARKSSSEELVITQVQPVIVSTVDLMKTRLRSEQIELESLIAEPETKAKIIPLQLGQVLINLLSNAIEALKECEDKRIRIMLYEEENSVKLSVEDSGNGILEDTMPKLFEPFYTTKSDGLGLGLSISLQIIQNMDGRLSIDSSELGGAKFTISLSAE